MDQIKLNVIPDASEQKALPRHPTPLIYDKMLQRHQAIRQIHGGEHILRDLNVRVPHAGHCQHQHDAQFSIVDEEGIINPVHLKHKMA